MEKSAIEERVRKLGPWFHKVDLGNGLTTKTESVFGEPSDHPLTTWEYVKQVIPEDLSGKTVLDIGCNGGFYAAEAAKRGGKVLGVEAKGHHVAQAQFVNEALGLDMQFQKGSLYDLNPKTHGQFDLVMCLGVIYHLKHLVAGIERLFLMTREHLIIETAIACNDNLGTVESFHFADNERSLYPLYFVENPIDSNEAAFNWFLPTAPCVQALLRSVGFVDVSEPILFRDRAVVTARKSQDYHSPEVASALAANIQPAQNAYHIRQGERLRIPVTALNSGLAKWKARGRSESDDTGKVRLTAHYLTASGVDLWRDVVSAPLDRDIIPGDTAFFEVDLHSPPEPGQYIIELDLLSEFIAHFEINGSPTAKIQLTVI